MRTIAQTDTSALPQARDIYTLHEFAAVYDLGIGRAHELYERFGPMRSRLDTLMLVISQSKNWKS
ncbi:hypothetical protein ASD00_19770 [Ensifer sp. Root31]|nr:hypothetical protein ASD00_19770 [Ensifer sp. Root31]